MKAGSIYKNMLIQKAFKTELKPNNKQRTFFEKSTGIARFAWNWGLAQRIDLYTKEKKSLSSIDQHKILCTMKKEEFPWMYEVSKLAPHEALRDLEKAFKNFFNNKKGFPNFKSKHKSKQSFKMTGDVCYITKSSIKLPKIGEIRLKEKNYIPITKCNSVTVSKTADRWFASVQCEVNISDSPKPETVLGIDLGIKTLATCSNGQVFKNNKYLSKSKKKLSFLQRNLSRKVNGSRNKLKTIKKVQKINYRISCQRKDSIHKMTTILAKTKPRYIVLEDLNVSGMMKNHKLAGVVSDASFYEIKRQSEYKTKWYGGEIIDVDQWFPSSKICSICGNIKENLTLKDRIYTCQCGNKIDRDMNASINLENYGLSTLSSRGIQACGESVRLLNHEIEEAVSLKQEINTASTLW